MVEDKCAPAIWRKLKPEQKLWWARFYRAFNEPMNFPTGLDSEDIKTQELRRIVAHNMALLAVWEMNGDIVRIVE